MQNKNSFSSCSHVFGSNVSNASYFVTYSLQLKLHVITEQHMLLQNCIFLFLPNSRCERCQVLLFISTRIPRCRVFLTLNIMHVLALVLFVVRNAAIEEKCRSKSKKGPICLHLCLCISHTTYRKTHPHTSAHTNSRLMISLV